MDGIKNVRDAEKTVLQLQGAFEKSHYHFTLKIKVILKKNHSETKTNNSLL